MGDADQMLFQTKGANDLRGGRQQGNNFHGRLSEGQVYQTWFFAASSILGAA
jgi:hypothetical protein